MSHRKGAALLAASALFGCASLVRAAEPQTADAVPASGLSLDRPVYLAESGPSDVSLMGLADRLGAKKTLGDQGLTIGGWVEGSLTYNFRNVQSNPGRVFDSENQDPTLNQLVVFVDKGVDMSKKTFQFGGRMEWMYGADARYIHSNGLFDYQSSTDGPNNQFDLTQLYVDLFFPVGNGLKVRAGKFVTPFGFETINPNTNAFYSHSYLFGYAIPFTHTGVLATYNFSDAFQVYGGFSRGWEQSLEDNNGCAIDFLGGFTWTINKQWAAIFNLSVGPEQFHNSSDYRTVFDLTLAWKLSDQCSLAFNGDFGWEQGSAPGGDDAAWYGIAAYLNYEIKKGMLALNVRGEWFADPDGVRGLGTTGAVYEMTVGLDYKPFASSKSWAGLRIRPEFRWDYSDDRFFARGTKNDQMTAGVDVIFGF